MIIKLFKWFSERLHRHYWNTTHTNRWMIATKQACRCGASREIGEPASGKPLDHDWVYSDGTNEPHYVSVMGK